MCLWQTVHDFVLFYIIFNALDIFIKYVKNNYKVLYACECVLNLLSSHNPKNSCFIGNSCKGWNNDTVFGRLREEYCFWSIHILVNKAQTHQYSKI